MTMTRASSCVRRPDDDVTPCSLLFGVALDFHRHESTPGLFEGRDGRNPSVRVSNIKARVKLLTAREMEVLPLSFYRNANRRLARYAT